MLSSKGHAEKFSVAKIPEFILGRVELYSMCAGIHYIVQDGDLVCIKIFFAERSVIIGEQPALPDIKSFLK